MLVGRDPFHRVLRYTHQLHCQRREADRIKHDLKKELVSLAFRHVFLHGTWLENGTALKGV